ncbi:gfo/Idh/MocA family oxidoreductase [Halobacteriales archaeon SW_12_67_38]|nr:MAG: gfo/Idh/MocA family oxidoreductase [Halobacteriales archaeon SW_12_67_38]
MGSAEPLRVGVIGVGSMGRNHARIYAELPTVELAGIADADADRAHEVAARHDTRAMDRSDLIASAEAVSIAVPTAHHYPVARECIEAGVHVLVEKPFVAEPAEGRELASLADERGVAIQVGHIERFNPAIQALSEILSGKELIAIDARRLGSPREREIKDGAVMDLMIHDIDVALSLVNEDLDLVNAVGTQGSRYVDAQLRFDGGSVASLTASRVTQRKVRELTITTRDAWIVVDYIDRSIEIHRQSSERYEPSDDARHATFHSRAWRRGIESNEGIIEQPMVGGGEPLKEELAAFVDCVETGDEPAVTAEDGLRALEVARTIDRLTRDALEVDA